MCEDLQAQIDELKGQLGRLRGRLAVLEYANIQAAKKLQPPAFSQWKQDIESKQAGDFTEGMPGLPIEYHNGVTRELIRLRNLSS